MQCERCGAPREDNASVCVRCGNKFPQPTSSEDAGIPSIDSFGDNSHSNQVTPHVDPSAQEVAPVQAGASSHIDSADAIEPVFNPVAGAVDPAATTVNPAATPVVSPVATPAASPVSPVVSPSPQASGSVSGTQNSHATSFFASKKNRDLAFIGVAIVVVLVIAFNVFNYFSGLIGPNDVKLILSRDSDLMQNGVIQSQFVNSSPYLVKDVAIEEQKDVTADIRNGYGDVPTAAVPTHVMRAKIKATIASENFETTFVTNILVSKTSEGWKALYPISTLPKDATTKPLKGVDKPSNTSSEVSYSESDLQENDGTYTSTVTANKHVKQWYGDAVYSWSDVYLSLIHI